MSFSDGQYLTRHRRCTVRLQPLFRFDHDRSARRQRLNLCSPRDGKPSVADLEDDPLADYVLNCRALPKLDHALHTMWFFIARATIPTWSAFLGCEPGHCHRRRLYVYDTGTARSTWWRSRRCSEPHAILRNLQGASEYSSSTGSCGNSMTRYIGCGSPFATLLPPICNNRDHRLFIDWNLRPPCSLD